jgi:hypothetical protein
MNKPCGLWFYLQETEFIDMQQPLLGADGEGNGELAFLANRVSTWVMKESVVLLFVVLKTAPWLTNILEILILKLLNTFLSPLFGFITKILCQSWALVAHISNHSYLGDRDQEDGGSKPA